MRRALAVLSMAFVVAGAGPVLACGVMISEEGEAELSGFEALLSWAGGRETVLVAVAYESPEEEFAWMMPFPVAPEVAEGSTEPIIAAQDISTPPPPPSDDGEGAGAPQVGGVDVIDREIVEDLELVTLGGEEAEDLERWMRRNGFAFHDTQEEVVQGYLDQGWVIVAARVLPGAPSEGAMVPVRFRFESDEPVYPLRVASSSHTDRLPMELYVVTPYRPASQTYEETIVPAEEGSFPDARDRLELRYSAPLTDPDRARLRSPGIRPRPGAWLTRYEASWRPASLGDDLVLARASLQEPVAFEGEQEEGLSPVTMIGLAAGGALVLLVALVVVSRIRRPSVV